MTWLNRWEIEERAQEFERHPVLGPATETLANLMEWTDRNSDGWPYWTKPSRAASKLMDLIEQAHRAAYRYDPDAPSGHWEPTQAEINAATRPIKAFRTRHGADFLTGEEAREARAEEARERARAETLGIPTVGRR